MERFLAARVHLADDRPAVRHRTGLPAGLDGPSNPETLSWPALVLAIPRGGSWYLERFTAKGAIVGDTWHQSLEDAQDQAKFEYEELLGRWQEILAANESDALEDALVRLLGGE